MLKNDKFDLPLELYEDFRDILREVVEVLMTKESLYAKTLAEYLNQLGKILFTGDKIDEAKMVQFMALVSEFLINQETKYNELE